MKWKHPPRIKILEALGAVADGRVKLIPGGALVASSSGGKTYKVSYDGESNSIMSNDNAAYWQGTLGYPAIAYLLLTGAIPYGKDVSKALAGIKWKDLNVKFKNDFLKTETVILEDLRVKGFPIRELEEEILRIETCLREMNPGLLGDKKKPPQGY